VVLVDGASWVIGYGRKLFTMDKSIPALADEMNIIRLPWPGVAAPARGL